MLKVLLFSLLISTLSAEITFKVSDVELAFKPLETKPAVDVIRYSTAVIPEDFEVEHEYLVQTELHPVVGAIHESFNEHRPLKLSPDTFWLLICQGLAKHINHNPKEMREYLVDFSGKKKLTVSRDSFRKGSKENDWPNVFPEFIEQIKENSTSDLANTMNLEFSTTTPTIQVAYQISIMDSFKAFFDYEMTSFCGIPKITLEGTPEDWRKLITKTKELKEYQLEWWINDIIPLLEKIHLSSKGEVNKEFWQSLYKHKSMSGGDKITGWIIKFFPYLEYNSGKTFKNDTIGKELPTVMHGLKMGRLPSAYSRVPFEWNYFGTTYEMEFLAGFMGISQEKDLTLKPEIAWVVREVAKEEKETPRRYQEALTKLWKTGRLDIDGGDYSHIEDEEDLDIEEIDDHSFDFNDLKYFVNLQGVKELSFHNFTELKDQYLEPFKDYKNLQSLSISSPKLTGDFLKSFKNHKKLKILKFYKCSLELKNLAILKDFEALEEVDFTGCKISIKVLDYLKDLKKLKKVEGLKLNGKDFKFISDDCLDNEYKLKYKKSHFFDLDHNYSNLFEEEESDSESDDFEDDFEE